MWNVGTPVKNFVGRREDLTTIHSYLMDESSEHKVVIWGCSGIGKTEMAIQYCHQKANSYDAINWLNAESTYTLSTGFRCISQHLGIPLADDDNIKSFVRNLTTHYRAKNVLFVLDNVKGEDSIFDCIYPESHNIKFLFTSQSNTWPTNVNKHELDLFTEDIAVNLIQSGIKSDLFCLEHCKQIVEKFGYLPLAIQLALCYMQKFEMSTSQYDILLNEEFERLRHRVFNLRNAKSINISFSIMIENIKKVEKDKGIIELARIISYLDGKEISENLLMHVDLEDGFNVKDALKLLTGYSLIKRNEATCHYVMYDLLQEALKDDISHSSEQLASSLHEQTPGDYVSKIINMIKKYKTTLDKHHTTYGNNWIRHIISIFNNYNEDKTMMEMLNAILMEVARILIENCGSYTIARDILQTKLTFEEKHNLPTAERTKFMIGECLLKRGDYDEALEIFREVYQMQTIKLGSDHPDTLSIYNNMGVCLCKKGEYDEALKIHRKVYQMQKLGSDNPHTLGTYNNIGGCLNDKGEYDEAIKIYREVYQMQKIKLGADHPGTLSTYNNMGGCLNDKGEYDEAIKIYREVYQMRKIKLGTDHPDTLNTYTNMGVCLCKKGEYDEAIKINREVYQMQKIKLGSDHPDINYIS